MRRHGYTLAEVLITLGIIGLIAALMLPLANKYKPDSIKAMYIKTYDSLLHSIQEMASNSKVYPIVTNNVNYNNTPFYNTVSVKLGDKTFGGNNAKFCELLATNLNTKGEVKCSEEYKAYEENNFVPSFTTTNGVQFYVTTDMSQNAYYQSEIYFDINGSKGDNCMYSAKCKNPDRFKLLVSSDGQVIIADPVGQFYLDSRSNWKKKDLEIANGSGIISSLSNELKNKTPEVLPEEETSIADSGSEDEDNSDEDIGNSDKNHLYACGKDFNYGNNILMYTPYPVNTYQSTNEQGMSQKPINIDVKVELLKPVEKDTYAHLRFMETKGGGFDVKTCTIPAGETSCTGKPINIDIDISNPRKITAGMDIDTIYNYTYAPPGDDFTMVYNSQYLNGVSFNPGLEVFARKFTYTSESNGTCVHVIEK